MELSKMTEKNTTLSKNLTKKNNEIIRLQKENIVNTSKIDKLNELLKKSNSEVKKISREHENNINNLIIFNFHIVQALFNLIIQSNFFNNFRKR